MFCVWFPPSLVYTSSIQFQSFWVNQFWPFLPDPSRTAAGPRCTVFFVIYERLLRTMVKAAAAISFGTGQSHHNPPHNSRNPMANGWGSRSVFHWISWILFKMDSGYLFVLVATLSRRICLILCICIIIYNYINHTYIYISINNGHSNVSSISVAGGIWWHCIEVTGRNKVFACHCRWS